MDQCPKVNRGRFPSKTKPPLRIRDDRDRMFSTFKEVVDYLEAKGVSKGDPLHMPIEEARKTQDRYFSEVVKDLPQVSRQVDLEIAGPSRPIPLRLYYPQSYDGSRCAGALFIRGGGWWVGSLDSHAHTMRLFANESRCIVCGIDYSRTPEFRYPVQKQEVLAAIAWLATGGGAYGVDGERLLAFGESAGATLALSAAQAMRDEGLQRLAGLILFYGNFGGPQPSSREYSKWVWRSYLADVDASDPGAVPLRGSMAGLPQIWLGAGDLDPLLADSLAVAKKLKEAGVPHRLVTYPDLPHAFVMMCRLVAPAAQAVADAAQAAQAILDSPAQPAKGHQNVSF